MWRVRICGTAIPTSVNQNIDTAAGLEAVTATENEKEEAYHTTCLVILRLSETLTMNSYPRQVLCNLLDIIIADAARA
jgi:alanyl-tRNA synthetase